LYSHIRTLALALTLATTGTLSAGVVTFSNAVSFNADSTGAWNHGGITATSGCCQDVFVEVGTYTAGANPIALPLNLTDGTYTLYLGTGDWTAGFGVLHGGVNLFFDGVSAPGISAYLDPTFDQTDFSSPFLANGAAITASEANSDIAGAGTLSYTNGTGATVTLTGLQWVGGSGSNPYTAGLTVIRADLTVSGAASGVPEPGSIVLLGTALLVIGGTRRRFLLRQR